LLDALLVLFWRNWASTNEWFLMLFRWGRFDRPGCRWLDHFAAHRSMVFGVGHVYHAKAESMALKEGRPMMVVLSFTLGRVCLVVAGFV